jgi:integrase
MALRGRNVRVRGAWWHYQFEHRGEPHSGSTGLAGTLENKTAAEEFAERKRRELLAPVRMEDRSRKPFDEASGEFTQWAKDIQYRSKPSTAERLRVSLTSAVMFFGDRPVSEIGAGELEHYKEFRVQEHGVRDVTLRHDLHALSVFFQYAMKMKWAARNPVDEIKIPSDAGAVREHVVSAKEEKAYFEAAAALHAEHLKSHANAQTNMADLARLMLEQGARPEELLAIRKEHFDAKAGTIFIAGGKTRSARRLLKLTAEARKIIERRMMTPGQWLFPSDRRPGHHVTKLQCTHDRICREAGVSFVIYDFRHTWATRMVETKADLPTIAALMGHSGLRTIGRYVHPTQEAQKAAMKRFEAAQKRRKLAVVKKRA